MLNALRRLFLGAALLLAASAGLLLSDLASRTGAASADSAPEKTARVALLQHASQAILDQGRAGMLAGLAERGWTPGQNLEVRNYNAEGDMPVAQAIAREMANGGHQLLLTISTPSLQAVANANRATQIPHVFALVTDPVAAGVGVNRENPLDHPAWLAGYGTMQPVAKAFATAREMNPSLRTVGVVWNAAEANSEAQVKLARKVCAALDIQLLEASVENTAGVAEAAASLGARGAEALWVNGDVTVITAIDSLLAAANKANIPVFTVIPPNVKSGALFDLGADYFEVGRLGGILAGEILSGKDPAAVPIENVMPEMLALNLRTAGKFSAKWRIPPALRERARLIVNEDGSEQAAPPPKTAAAPNPS
ncbi:MAG TPA: ABC transporter substrate-binding protein, partial [Chthoniobacterales bacterium]